MPLLQDIKNIVMTARATNTFFMIETSDLVNNRVTIISKGMGLSESFLIQGL